MLTKTLNVSGTLNSTSGISVSCNYSIDNNTVNIISFWFTKDNVNINGSYNVSEKKLSNYSVNNGTIADSVIEEVKTSVLDVIAADPEADSLFKTATTTEAADGSTYSFANAGKFA